jgi:hypothetical protein
MKGWKNWILSAICAVCALAGVATLQVNNEVTADAAVAAEYTVVDDSFFIKIGNEYAPNGNFNLWITIPSLDTGDKESKVSFDGVNLSQVMDNFGFFDKVKIGDKSLREYGCTSFWENSIGFNDSDWGNMPKNNVHFYCHADPALWSAAVDNGEVVFNKTEVTVEKGALIPGYAYLNGDNNAKVYRAGCDYVMEASGANYGIETHGMTDVEELSYVQGHDGTCGYFGVSLVGDDFLGDGTQLLASDSGQYKFVHFANNLLVNGETGKVKYYGLYNLGEAGMGYYSFQIYLTAEEVTSITIPAGTKFPSRALTTLNANKANNNAWPVVVYETQTDKTFYKNAEGKFVSFEGYAAHKGEELTELYNEKVAADCFAEDVAAMETAIANAQTAMNAATTIAGVDEAFTAAKAVLDSVETKAAILDGAKAALDGYKAEEGYFRAAEVAERAEIVAAAKTALDSATDKKAEESAVDAAKAAIDGLKTAAQYADEELAEEKANANAVIEGYCANVVYLEEQAALCTEAVTAGLAAVAAAKSSEEITAAVERVKTAIDGLKTKSAIVDAAKAELDAYKAEEGLYREAEAAERAALIATAYGAMESATAQAAVNQAVETAKTAIDGLKTDAELDAEEKAAADAVLAGEKEIALSKVNELKASVDYSKYTSENQMQINNLYKAVKALIEEALTAEEIAAAVAAFETDLADVPTKETGNNGNGCVLPDGDTDAEQSSGCASSVGVAGVAALTCLLGAAVCFKKGEEE